MVAEAAKKNQATGRKADQSSAEPAPPKVDLQKEGEHDGEVPQEEALESDREVEE